MSTIHDRQIAYYNHSDGYLEKLKKHTEITYESYVAVIKGNTLPTDKSLLEIGCGTGISSYLISKKIPKIKVTGGDISKRFINEARKKFTGRNNLTYKVTDAISLPFPKHSFDIITLFDAIEHISDQKKFTKELDRILKPGGRVIVFSPNAYNLYLPYRDFIKRRSRLPYTRHVLENIPWLFRSLTGILAKNISSEPIYEYQKPLFQEKYAKMSDTDLVYLANPIDLKRGLEKLRYRILNVSTFGDFHPRLKSLSKLFDGFFSIKLVAVKPY
jgi:ubiquinone/menaquinone biosynthesis C-methylase UbiE